MVGYEDTGGTSPRQSSTSRRIAAISWRHQRRADRRAFGLRGVQGYCANQPDFWCAYLSADGSGSVALGCGRRGVGANRKPACELSPLLCRLTRRDCEAPNPVCLLRVEGRANTILGFTLPVVLIEVLNAIVAWVAAALLVNRLGGYAEMGIYSAALRVTQIPAAILGMLAAPIIPILSESFGKSDHHSYRTTLRLFLLISTLVIVPVSLLQASAPELTFLPFGREYEGRPLIVSWLMLHAVFASLGSCVGYVLVTTGRVWLVWLLSFGFASCYALTTALLVPRYGAVGFAASLPIAYAASTIPGVAVLYRSYPDAMRHARWATLALASLSFLALCFVASRLCSFPWAVSLGIIASLSFVALILRSSRL